eukprot:CAMPEP_0118995978 /NCGR_PEP_ID=MMETSP1173-20130426/59321_1 /TAXON_ID=1034831 /ORGANISM="Rhizochromulina marina cf, Strain CCMP1243" /LENGTH=96 /DNA_ID=CAMNT_0006947347 /DNA_START=420 /DNA_END=711 /DNA_ORIENTATION=+
MGPGKRGRMPSALSMQASENAVFVERLAAARSGGFTPCKLGLGGIDKLLEADRALVFGVDGLAIGVTLGAGLLLRFGRAWHLPGGLAELSAYLLVC